MIAHAGRKFNRLSENPCAERQMFADANRPRGAMRAKAVIDRCLKMDYDKFIIVAFPDGERARRRDDKSGRSGQSL